MDLLTNQLSKPGAIPTKFCDRMDSAAGRWYADSELKQKCWVPSVTTVLNCLNKGKGFEMWLGNSPSYEYAMDYAHEAARIGSIVHYFIMKLLEGDEIDINKDFFDEETEESTKLDKRVGRRLEGFVEFHKDHKPELIANEITLFNDIVIEKEHIFPWAGQCDQVYKIDGKYIMCDNKTGKTYNSHGLQLTAYKLLWDSLFPDMIIDELWGLYLSDKWIKKPYTIKKYKYEPDMWLKILDTWLWEHGGSTIKLPQPKPKKEEKKVFKLDIVNQKGEVQNGKN